MALDQLYQTAILEHNRHPCGRGKLNSATHSARGHDALCGDDIQIELRVIEGRVAAAGFTGDACAITMATASLLMGWLPGHTPDQVTEIYRHFRQMLEQPEEPAHPSLAPFAVLQTVGHFKTRVRNALLPWHTLLAALDRRAETDNSAGGRD